MARAPVARQAALLALLVASFGAQRLLGEGAESDPEPVASGLEVTAEARGYLDRVQAICRAHDREIAGAGMVPVLHIVRSEEAVTDRIASLPTPPDAREIRRRLLGARRTVDRTARWQYRLMANSEHPLRTYRRRVRPVLARRVPRMYQTFGSFGVHCDTSPQRNQKRGPDNG